MEVIEIRPTVLEDLPSLIVDTLNPTFSERIYLAITEPIPVGEALNHHATHLTAGHPHWVAVKDGAIVGMCEVSPSASPRIGAQQHNGTLGMFLVPSARGKGIGERLIREVIAACGTRWERIELSVFSHNERAHRLYQRVGFVEEGRRIGAWKLDGITSDIIEMAYRPR
jgi:RimJ/RimL family protein N-acetyltransferase